MLFCVRVCVGACVCFWFFVYFCVVSVLVCVWVCECARACRICVCIVFIKKASIKPYITYHELFTNADGMADADLYLLSFSTCITCSLLACFGVVALVLGLHRHRQISGTLHARIRRRRDSRSYGSDRGVRKSRRFANDARSGGENVPQAIPAG